MRDDEQRLDLDGLTKLPNNYYNFVALAHLLHLYVIKVIKTYKIHAIHLGNSACEVDQNQCDVLSWVE
jgi:hypothetical protein